MKRLLTLCVSVACGLAVLASCGCRAHPGFHFGVDLPSYIEADSSVLVNNSGVQHQSQPMGNVAGPVIEGNFTHGVAGALRMRNAASFRGNPCIPPNAAVEDCGPGTNLTADDWRRITTEIKNAKQMPRGSD